MLLSIVCVVLVIFEIQFQKRWEKPRWFTGIKDAQVPLFVMPLIKLNNVLRLTTFVGLFVTTIFYLTKKVIAVYGLAVLINIVTIILLLVAESKIGEELDGKSDQEKKDAKIDEDSIGGSPVVLLVFNMILPLVFGPSFYWLYG